MYSGNKISKKSVEFKKEQFQTWQTINKTRYCCIMPLEAITTHTSQFSMLSNNRHGIHTDLYGWSDINP